MVCRYICNLYDIVFPYDKNLAELSAKILLVPDGAARLKLQNDNFVKIQSKIRKILDYEIEQKGKVKTVTWVGRNLLSEITSDVDVRHAGGQKTGFSIKSIASTGTGTLKNLGARQIKKYLGVDFSNEYKQMWEELRKYLKDFNSAQEQIKRKVQRNQKLLNWAAENGKKYQVALNEKCLRGFNSLPLINKIEFLNFITDCDSSDLYVVIVNSANVIIYKPVEKNLDLIKNIEIKKDKITDVGYTIFVDDKPTYRVQTNNTNGIGISAFCQRIFWI